ncbi:PREDICTED: uncharacterized protein LOC109341683 [Lupinus angustifolius]|uniref:uncharacterized protein LOC109341683 n=1 Tax=Lupinus angustifolius TaxID=3871 RepID=UPI00092EE9F9|nr:PREDICTED: uncharacterized protein LOC109341683 [Lupinus angustifolius]
MCLSNKLDLVFIAEPMIVMDDVNNLFWDGLNLKFFAPNNRGSLLPNLWGLCNKSLNPVMIASSNQYIAVSLTMENKIVHLCVVYAHSHYIQRRSLWDDIITVMRQTIGPWNCIGDFNVVRGANECRGSRLPCSTPSRDFLSFSEEANLVHLETKGAVFTWSNKRRGSALTEKRLDRSLFNDDWLSTWNSVNCCTLPRISSDHHHILLCSSCSMSKRTPHFRFQKMWMKHPDCLRVIHEVWNEEIVGCPMFIVAEKLKKLKAKLKIWNWTVFGNIHLKVQEALSHVEHIQSCINNEGPSEELLDQDGNAQLNLLKVLSMEDDFWKEKSRINWHMNGDRNTNFFHKIIKIRQVSKSMTVLKDGERIISNQDELATHTLDYFTTLFATPNELNPNLLIQNVIPHMVLHKENTDLISLPSDEEIRSTVFSLNGDGGPGPDGFGGNFYQNYWSIVSKDVSASVQQFFAQS